MVVVVPGVEVPSGGGGVKTRSGQGDIPSCLRASLGRCGVAAGREAAAKAVGVARADDGVVAERSEVVGLARA